VSQPDSNYHQALTANRKLLEQVAALQAENERLRLEVAGRAAVVDANKTLHQQTDLFRRLYAEEEAKVKSLKAEVERLRKAGDGLMFEGETMAHEVSWNPPWDRVVAAWVAAKEGRDAK